MRAGGAGQGETCGRCGVKRGSKILWIFYSRVLLKILHLRALWASYFLHFGLLFLGGCYWDQLHVEHVRHVRHKDMACFGTHFNGCDS
jgi:hypothetical protein